MAKAASELPSRQPAACSPLDEEALRRFDAAMPSGALDERLLQGTPARDLGAALARVVASLRAIDVEAVARKQGWLARLTGADLEARLQLELACRRLNDQMAAARAAAAACEQAMDLMGDTTAALAVDQGGLDGLIARGREMLFDDAGGADPDLVSRLERRLANAMALHAANVLAVSQMQMAVAHARRLVDRFHDVDKLLFPVWQRHAMAVAGAPASEDALPQLETLKSLHARFVASVAASEEVESV